MFWKYNNQNPNHIDALLNKQDVTLQELMDEEDILQECKSQNKKLIDFLCRPEILEQLVTLTTSEPPSDLNVKTRFKYPNVACELLTCDVPAVNENLAANESLSKLYAFLEQEPPLNPLLASFFSKTLGILVARRSEQNWYSYQITCLRALEFLQSKENCITLLLNHLRTSAIMDLLLKIMTQIEGTEMKQNLITWLETQKVIPSLIALLDPSVDSERHCNVSQLLSDVIRKSRENLLTDPEPNPILDALEKQETVSELLDYILSGETKSESSIVGGIAVLLTLIEIIPPRAPDTASYVKDATTPKEGDDVSSLPTVVLTTSAAILPRLKDFHALLLNPPQKPPVKTTVGLLDPPFGNTRLQIARLISALIATNNPIINQELANLGTLEVLLDLFFKYQWNNFLHTQVEQCISAALQQQTKASGDGDPLLHCLVEHLLVKCELLRRILDAWEENDANQSKEKGQRRGYMGHLIKIANHVVDHVEKCSLRPILVKLLAPEVLAVWEEFVNCTLAEVNKTHNIALGGAPPTQAMGLDKEEANYKQDAFQDDASNHQAFTDYQLQEMAPPFCENFGYHDNEFNVTDDTIHSSVDRLPDMAFALNEDDEDVDRQCEVFKQVCAKNVRSLEDAEENAWEDTDLGSYQTSENESRKWHNEKDGNDHSSSDEGEDDDDEKEKDEIMRLPKPDVQMDVDAVDIWSTGAATLDTIADFQDPWGSVPTPNQQPDAFGSADGDWADFSSFQTNFSSSTQLNDDKQQQETTPLFGENQKNEESSEKSECKKLPIEHTSVSEIDMEDSRESDTSESTSRASASGTSFVKADANANPTTFTDDITSTATAMVDEVATAAVAAVRVVVSDKLGLDNHRFLGNVQEKSDASGPPAPVENALGPVSSEDSQDLKEEESSVADDLHSEAL